MNIALERKRILEQVESVEEEWLILALQRLLGIRESNEKAAFEIWKMHFAAPDAEAMIVHIDEAESDIAAGRTILLDDYLKTI